MSKMKQGCVYERTVKAIADQKRIKCSVCGCEFTPMNDEAHYVAKRSDGALADAFDCPQCGCQVTVGERYERVEPTEGENYCKTYEEACAAYDDVIRRRVTVVEYAFPSVKSFTRALESIHECMEICGFVMLSDWKDIVGEPSSYDDSRVGWDNIINMKIEVTGNGYTLIMPPFNWEAN